MLHLDIGRRILEHLPAIAIVVDDLEGLFGLGDAQSLVHHVLVVVDEGHLALELRVVVVLRL